MEVESIALEGEIHQFRATVFFLAYCLQGQECIYLASRSDGLGWLQFHCWVLAPSYDRLKKLLDHVFVWLYSQSATSDPDCAIQIHRRNPMRTPLWLLFGCARQCIKMSTKKSTANLSSSSSIDTFLQCQSTGLDDPQKSTLIPHFSFTTEEIISKQTRAHYQKTELWHPWNVEQIQFFRNNDVSCLSKCHLSRVFRVGKIVHWVTSGNFDGGLVRGDSPAVNRQHEAKARTRTVFATLILSKVPSATSDLVWVS